MSTVYFLIEKGASEISMKTRRRNKINTSYTEESAAPYNSSKSNLASKRKKENFEDIGEFSYINNLRGKNRSSSNAWKKLTIVNKSVNEKEILGNKVLRTRGGIEFNEFFEIFEILDYQPKNNELKNDNNQKINDNYFVEHKNYFSICEIDGPTLTPSEHSLLKSNDAGENEIKLIGSCNKPNENKKIKRFFEKKNKMNEFLKGAEYRIKNKYENGGNLQLLPPKNNKSFRRKSKKNFKGKNNLNKNLNATPIAQDFTSRKSITNNENIDTTELKNDFNLLKPLFKVPQKISLEKSQIRKSRNLLDIIENCPKLLRLDNSNSILNGLTNNKFTNLPRFDHLYDHEYIEKSDDNKINSNYSENNIENDPETEKESSYFNLEEFKNIKRIKFSNSLSFYNNSLKDKLINHYLFPDHIKRRLFLSEYTKFRNLQDVEFSGFYQKKKSEFFTYKGNSYKNGLKYYICDRNLNGKEVFITERIYKSFGSHY